MLLILSKYLPAAKQNTKLFKNRKLKKNRNLKIQNRISNFNQIKSNLSQILFCSFFLNLDIFKSMILLLLGHKLTLFYDTVFLFSSFFVIIQAKYS